MSEFVVPKLSTTSPCSVHSDAGGLLHLRIGANNHNFDNANLTAAEHNILLPTYASSFFIMISLSSSSFQRGSDSRRTTRLQENAFLNTLIEDVL